MDYRDRVERIKNRIYQDRVIVSGILNVIPDSFSDGGSYKNVQEAVKKSLDMEKDGSELIDIGGESTRPGYTPVSVDEELSRIIPVIDGIREQSDVAISVDTTKPEVAREAVRHGVCVINDISCAADDGMLPLVHEAGCMYVLMHNRKNTEYADFYNEYLDDINNALSKAERAGVSRDMMMIDPGVGFAKNTAQNLIVIRKLSELSQFGMPIYLGVSRKSVIGNTLNLPVDQRLEGSLAIENYGVMNGAKIVRVHDVRETVRSIRMLEAIIHLI